MNTTYYDTKIDWWVPAIVIFTVAICMIGPLFDSEAYWVSLVLASCVLIIMVVMFASVKYQICNGMLGVRNFIYRWEWFPINKISEVKKTKGILSAAALSTKRIAIKFSDKKILKSSMPIEISPKDRDAFIAKLKEINPNITIK